MDAVCGLTIWIITLAICFFNMMFSIGVLFSTSAENSGVAAIIFLSISVLWQSLLIVRTLYIKYIDIDTLKDTLKDICQFSYLGIMVLLTCSFTFFSRAHYYRIMPKEPKSRDDTYSSLTVHKMGIFLLMAGIPVIYECQCKKIDKKVLYKVMVDFIDIYELAEVLALGAPSCTPLHSSKAQNSTMTNEQYNNTMNGEIYNHTRLLFNCTESPFAALREEGPIEITVQVLCSLSFLMFFIIYREAMQESKSNSNENVPLEKKLKISRFLQDFSFLGIRICVWVLYGFETDQFVFLVKNVVSGSVFSLKYCQDKDTEHQETNATHQESQTNLGYDNNAA